MKAIDELRTLQSTRLLIEQIARMTGDNISELYMARMDLTRELKCSSKEDRKFFTGEIEKLDSLILKIKGIND